MKMFTKSVLSILFILLLALNTALPVSAQVSSKAGIAIKLLQSKSAETQLGAEELSAMKVSSETFSSRSGLTSIYFQQYINEIPVHGAILNAHVTKGNELLTYGNRFVPLAKAGIKGNAQPVLTPEQALHSALKSLNIKENGVLVQKSEDNTPVHLTVFDKGSIAMEDIKVQLVYQPLENQNQGVRLAWEVEIYTADAQNWWLARIDAETGELLDKNNYVAQCDFGVDHASACKLIETDEASNFSFYDVNSDFSKPLVLPNPPFALPALNQYKVYPHPYESPNHITPAPPADGRVLVSDPASPTASPFGWHDTNGVDGAEFTTTQGNNAHAYTDIDGNNVPDAGSSPDGGADLVFNFPIDLTQAPSFYRPAVVTNLFYWNNYIHDFAYAYGFDELSGNFQVNNYGNGGLGNDYVQAEAQDGSGTNNANFATPPDGQKPRMQMYIGTDPTPDVDGDLDNAVIAHEYAHGISNRLTGGPANVSCLGNNEQMGEGWSDFFGLMSTMKPTDIGTGARGIGTYLFGQPANGPGIRPTPYSTDMTINPVTYNTIKTSVVPHGVGYVWCGMIWDLAWAMIEDHGQSAGFDVAMNLVTEGMRLQPCSPGFVDGRNAILAADLELYAGANRCRIWEVFARRGLGFSALQGSSGSIGDGTEAFDVPNFCLLEVTPGSVSVCSPANAEYNSSNGTGETLTLSATGNPAGTTVTFSANPISDGSTGTMTIGNTGAAATGSYTLTVTGTGTSVNVSATVTLIIQSGVPGVPNLVSPANLAVNLVNPTLTWDPVATAETYDVQVATDNAFTNVIAGATGLTNPAFNTVGLNNLTSYFWRSRGVNACGDGDYSAPFSFTTANIVCNTFVSSDVPKTIPTTVATITSTLNIPGCGGTITDLNLLGLNITHTFVNDLVIDLTSPGGTTVRLMNRPCGSQDNILINFDDEAASPTFPCPPTDNGYYQPFAPLSAFDGENLAGMWTLTVADVANLDGGSLNGWSLEICYGSEEITCYRDQDVDTYGDAGNTQTFCSVCGAGYVSVAGDCDDAEASVNPGAAEICGNGIDDNCDGTVDENGAAPAASCKSYSAMLNSSGQASVSAANVDNGSTYACGLQSMTVSPNTFSCLNLGPNTVVLTVTDINGNSSTCQATVTVVDNEAPAITTLPNALDATLEYTDAAGIAAALDLAPAATDNCAALPTIHLISDNTVISPANSNEYVQTRVWNFTDGNGNTSLDFTQVITVFDGSPSTCTATGNITYQVWNNITGMAVSNLTSNVNYPDNPTSTQFLTSMEGPTDVTNNYGARIAGYICAPATGDYTFWIASDDNGELWLSTDNQPANKQKIAFHIGWTAPRLWNKYPTQKSAVINLTQGQTYYVEALMKEGGGGDNLAVGWLKPGETGSVPSEVVPGSVLSPFVPSGPVLVSAVTLPPVSAVNVGSLVLIPATVSPSNAANSVLAWSTSDPLKATVNSNGLVSGLSAGDVTITATSTDGTNLSGSCLVSVIAIPPVCSATGNITYQVWNDIPGVAVSNLTSNINYPYNPTTTQLITSMEGATDVANNYGARIAGYVCAPLTGSYTFWIASDDNAELWLSTDDQPANAQKIAFHTGYTGVRQWNKYATQKSAAVNLVQGQKYYISALMKEGGGGDNLAVGWLIPGQSGTEPSEVVPGSVLSPLDLSQPILVSSVTLPATSSVNVGSQVSIPATVLPLNAANMVLSWSTSDPGKASVDGTGLVSGLSGGDVTITATSTDGTNLSGSCLVSVIAIPPACSATGNITYQVWNNISGNTVSNLTSNVNYPNNPTTTQVITSMEGPTNVNNNYGARIAGYLCAPLTGSYTFWIASDDNAELWLSTDNNPLNVLRIAFHTGYTGVRQWNKYPTQKSAAINLVQGQTYYVEALMKEGGGNDNLAVGWLIPGQTGTEPSEVVPGSVLSSLNPTVKTGETTAQNPSVTKKDLKLMVYPNPLITDVLNIELENLSSAATLKIFTASGVECYEGIVENSGTIQVDRSVFKAGVYIIKVYNEHFVKTTKLVVN